MSGPAAALAAILDRLIPADDGPGAVECGLADAVYSRVPRLDGLLERLAGFEAWSAEDQDAALVELEQVADPVFAALVDAALTLFYADPRSWPQLGYTTNVPGRP